MQIMRAILGFACLAFIGSASAQEFEIKRDDVAVLALSCGSGGHVVLALPGAKPGTQPKTKSLKYLCSQIAKNSSDIQVISLSWSGAEDVSAAVQYATDKGAQKVSLLGHSRGAEMAARYASSRPDGEFNTLVLLSSADDQGIPLTKTKKLFVYNKGDSYARGAPISFEKSAEPKQMMSLGGSGHGFKALKAERPNLVNDIIEVLERE